MATKPRARVQAAPPPGATEKERRFRLPVLAMLSSDLRTLFINICLLGAFIVLIPVIGTQFIRTQVIIEPISVPSALADRGLTADVAANRLWDGLQAAQTQAATSKAGISAIPNSQRVDFSIPDSGISIDALVYYVRQFFHAYQTRISGEFRCGDPDCRPDSLSLRVRVTGDQLQVIQLPPIGRTSEDDYFRNVGIEVLKELDPFTASAAEAHVNPAAAMAMAEKLVLQHAPDAKWAHNLIGTLKEDQGDFPGAVAEFRAALALDPGFVAAETNLGSALVAAGDLKGAAQVFDATAKIVPDDKFLAMGRANLAVAQGDMDGAVKDLLDADARDPGSSLYLSKAAFIAFKAGETDKATDLANRALAVDPGAVAPISLLAALYLAAGADNKAEAVYRHAADFAPDNADFEAGLADVLLSERKYPESLTRIDSAIAAAPQEVAYQITRARALNSLARYQEALGQLDATAKLDPANADIVMEYGDDYRALGRNADAEAAYNKVIAMAPGSRNAELAAIEIKVLSAARRPDDTAATPGAAPSAGPAAPAAVAPAVN